MRIPSRLGRFALPFALLAACACVRPRPEATGPRVAKPAGEPVPAPPATPLPALDEARARGFATLSLACIDRPWPHKSDLVQEGPDDVRAPADLTPAFFGCFDWHSAVHGHWAMLQVLRRFPGLPEAPRAREVLKAHLTPERLQAEAAVFARPGQRTFERPYGWGWLLRLAADLRRWDDPDAAALSAALQPLATRLANAAGDYLARLTVPVRAGTHNNTAYAMSHWLTWARAAHDDLLEATLGARARVFFQRDRACPVAYEPSGEDFLSPCLAEADLMRRILPRDEFLAWLDAFLPAPGSEAFRSLLAPVRPHDRRDPRIGHLIGLSFHRATALRGVASALPPSDPRRALFEGLAALHAADGLEQMADSGYGGEHWLATFAIAALSDVEP